MRVRGITVAVVLAAVIALAGAAPAAAATGPHVPLVTAGILGSIFGSLGHAVLGAFSWTVGLASKFILTTIGALVRMLIPRSWANKGVEIMEWIVAVPNYAGTVTTPAGRTVYGFGGINALRDLFTWIGVGLLPLTLLYGTTRAMLGERGHVAVPIARVLAIAAVLVSYPYWWTEAAAMTDTVTHMVLTLPRVASGLHQLMLYAVDGIALGGWELVDLAVMAFVAIELLSLIFLKVVIILLGALLYATGPLTIGLVATESGAAVARAWASAVVMLVALPVAWATLFAVGALLLGDAGTAGPLIAGHEFGRLAARRGVARGRRRRHPVDVPARGARGDGAVAAAARRAARFESSGVVGRRARGDECAIELRGFASAVRREGRVGGRRRRRPARHRRAWRCGGRASGPRGGIRRAPRRAPDGRGGRPCGGRCGGAAGGSDRRSVSCGRGCRTHGEGRNRRLARRGQSQRISARLRAEHRHGSGQQAQRSEAGRRPRGNSPCFEGAPGRRGC